MLKLKFLITGVPKGATTYMCKLLTSLDIMCGHESIFKYYGLEYAKRVLKKEIKATTSYCSSFNQITQERKNFNFNPNIQQAESSYMSAPFLSDKILEDTKIIFVVRNPWNTATSFHHAAKMWHKTSQGSQPYIKFCEQHAPDVILEDKTINKSIRFIISWFKLIEKNIPKNNIIFQAEKQITPELLNFLEIKDVKKQPFNNIKENSWRTGKEIPIKKTDIASHLLNDWLNICDKYDYPLDNQENTKKIFIL